MYSFPVFQGFCLVWAVTTMMCSRLLVVFHATLLCSTQAFFAPIAFPTVSTSGGRVCNGQQVTEAYCLYYCSIGVSCRVEHTQHVTCGYCNSKRGYLGRVQAHCCSAAFAARSKVIYESVFLLGWVTNSDFDHAKVGVAGAHVEESCVVRCIGACSSMASTQLSTINTVIFIVYDSYTGHGCRAQYK